MLRFAIAVFLSAFLLFGVQPLVGKYALPWWGGAPAVWAACLVFFQVGLLGGYAYAHASATRLSPRRGARLHLVLLGLALMALALRVGAAGTPLAPGAAWKPEGGGFALGRLLLMLTATAGLPFFVLSATGPLLQAWFARVHPGARPYRLYALSNAGSLLALLAYPFLLEPLTGRGAQAWGWAALFVLFVAVCGACALAAARAPAGVAGGVEAPATLAPAVPGARRRASPDRLVVFDDAPPEEAPPAPPHEAPARAPTPRERVAWVALAAVPTVLLLAVTQQLSQDVAAGPFLWVGPLALYLVSFILTFERPGAYARRPFALLLFGGVAGVTYVLQEGAHTPLWQQLSAYALALFAACVVCHGELYRRRPHVAHLSGFYLWVSLGGALGGLFVALAAPRLFRFTAELPLGFGACCALVAWLLLRPDGRERPAPRGARWATALGLAVVAFALGRTAWQRVAGARYVARNDFGVLQVREAFADAPELHQYSLRHGAILHGFQHASPLLRGRPTAYFTRESGLGLALAGLRELKALAGGPRALRFGVLGLGVGTSAALAEPGDTVRFYEINPEVVRLARGEGGFFSFLALSPARVELAEGDARLVLERELAAGRPQRFDLLALDVFSSDAIPVHLFTREAMRLYRAHLAPGGVLALHVSNVHLDLVPVGVAHARALGMELAAVLTPSEGDAVRSTWLLLTEHTALLATSPFWGARERLRLPEVFASVPGVEWTDERSSLLPVLEGGPEVPDAADAPAVRLVPTPSVARPGGP